MQETSRDLCDTTNRCWAVFGTVILYSFVLGIGMIPVHNGAPLKLYGALYMWVIFGTIVVTTIIMHKVFFNSWEKFNLDTICLFITYVLLEVFLIICMTLLSYKHKTFLYYVREIFHYILFVVLLNSSYFWFIYYHRCLETIQELNKDIYVFFASSAKLMLGAILVWWSSTKIIESFNNNTDYEYYVFNILINFSYPLIGMYTYVRSEINKFDEQKFEMDKKEHSEVNETEAINKETNGENKGKIQYNDVEQFINIFAHSDDLDNLEKIIAKKRKELEKEQFDDFKRYVNKVETFEDLDNLEKIIAKKRDDLEKNNDTEKRMD